MTVDTDQLIWIIPVTLLLIVVLQMLYLSWLRMAPGGERRVRQPNEPVLPNIPRSNIPSDRQVYDDVYGRMIVTEGMQRREFALPTPEFIVGRQRDEVKNVLIALDERSVSRRHAQITARDSDYYVTDLGSSNGTFVQIEGVFEQLTPNSPRRIFDDDVVRFGKKVNVRFVLPTEQRGTQTRI